MSYDTFGFIELMDAVEKLDPKWKLNPPRPGTVEWRQLSKEDQLELIPRFARKLRIQKGDINKLGDREVVYKPELLFGGIEIIEHEWMPKGYATLLDQNDNVLMVIKLDETLELEAEKIVDAKDERAYRAQYLNEPK